MDKSPRDNVFLLDFLEEQESALSKEHANLMTDLGEMFPRTQLSAQPTIRG